jgi:uncharacterized protein
MLSGLEFKPSLPILPSLPQRTDVACFIGFVDARSFASTDSLPPALRDWFTTQGWVNGTYSRSSADLTALLDIPVPIQSWAEFTTLFDPEARDWTGQGGKGSTYLAAAVRSFFTAGGRKCYVVRVGNPRRGLGNVATRQNQIQNLIPNYPNPISCSVLDPSSWRGLGHLLGLTDVSFVALPDLPDLVQVDLPPLKPPSEPLSLPEQFVECSQPSSRPKQFDLRAIPAPQCDPAGYTTWAAVIHQIGQFLATRQAGSAVLREIQLVAAVPLPTPDSAAAQDLRQGLDSYLAKTLNQDASMSPSSIASAFVQLVYPWVQTAFSRRLPAQLEPPEGLLVGTLAHNALTRGTFRSAAYQLLLGVEQVFPQLSRSQLHSAGGDRKTSLLDRVSLIGSTPQGWRLLSDVTTSLDEAYRPACLNRLMAAIVRMARHTGELAVFEASSERLWADIRSQLETLLLGFWNAGALRGASPAEAFEVRCDRSTFTQADIDNGRVIAQVTVAPAQPITHITVMLTVTQSGVDRLPAVLPAIQKEGG